nr:phenylalanine--tRNA ligase subunit beta [Parachlamydiaceae bacterium]
QWDGKDLFELQIPTYRADITGEIDIIEEIARIYGYDNITPVEPKYHGSELPHAAMYLFEKKARSHMLSRRLQEFITCDLIGPTLLNVIKVNCMPADATIQVLNPTSIEQSILRTSLLPGLLQLVKYNHDHQNSHLAGFEIGRIHFKSNGNYKEQSMLGIVMAGDADLAHWSRKSSKLDFFDLKGVIESFLSGIGIKNLTFIISSLNTFHPGRQLTIHLGDLKIGALGEVHPAIIKRLDVPERILFAEINLHDLYQMRIREEKILDLPLFPASERDWTITISKEVPIADVFDKIRSISSELLEEVTLIDIYESDKLGKDVRNATFHFIYRDKQKTIAQATVDAEHSRIVDGAIKNGLRSL